MSSSYTVVLDREIHYMDWAPEVPAKEGEAKPKLLVCWHGLTRTGRDFDQVAQLMTKAPYNYRVVCPDTLGRGLSQWSPKPDEEYVVPFYIQLANGLLEHLGYTECDWLGTSMGGLIGYIGAASLLKGKIDKLLLNDIGPEINPEGLARIFKYTAAPPSFDRFSEFESYYQNANCRDFGECSPEFIRRTQEAYCRRTAEGKLTVHYDPRLIEVIKKAMDPATENERPKIDPWPIWQAVECSKILVFKGEKSDLLKDEALAKMSELRPQCKSVVIEGCGHAPAFTTEKQLTLVAEFFGGKE